MSLTCYWQISYLPLYIVQSLPLDYAMQHLGITEEGYDEISVVATLDTSSHHLMHNVVDRAVQKIIPGKFKK